MSAAVGAGALAIAAASKNAHENPARNPIDIQPPYVAIGLILTLAVLAVLLPGQRGER